MPIVIAASEAKAKFSELLERVVLQRLWAPTLTGEHGFNLLSGQVVQRDVSEDGFEAARDEEDCLEAPRA